MTWQHDGDGLFADDSLPGDPVIRTDPLSVATANLAHSIEILYRSIFSSAGIRLDGKTGLQKGKWSDFTANVFSPPDLEIVRTLLDPASAQKDVRWKIGNLMMDSEKHSLFQEVLDRLDTARETYEARSPSMNSIESMEEETARIEVEVQRNAEREYRLFLSYPLIEPGKPFLKRDNIRSEKTLQLTPVTTEWRQDPEGNIVRFDDERYPVPTIEIVGEEPILDKIQLIQTKHGLECKWGNSILVPTTAWTVDYLPGVHTVRVVKPLNLYANIWSVQPVDMPVIQEDPEEPFLEVVVTKVTPQKIWVNVHGEQLSISRKNLECNISELNIGNTLLVHPRHLTNNIVSGYDGISQAMTPGAIERRDEKARKEREERAVYLQKREEAARFLSAQSVPVFLDSAMSIPPVPTPELLPMPVLPQKSDYEIVDQESASGMDFITCIHCNTQWTQNYPMHFNKSILLYKKGTNDPQNPGEYIDAKRRKASDVLQRFDDNGVDINGACTCFQDAFAKASQEEKRVLAYNNASQHLIYQLHTERFHARNYPYDRSYNALSPMQQAAADFAPFRDSPFAAARAAEILRYKCEDQWDQLDHLDETYFKKGDAPSAEDLAEMQRLAIALFTFDIAHSRVMDTAEAARLFTDHPLEPLIFDAQTNALAYPVLTINQQNHSVCVLKWHDRAHMTESSIEEADFGMKTVLESQNAQHKKEVAFRDFCKSRQSQSIAKADIPFVLQHLPAPVEYHPETHALAYPVITQSCVLEWTQDPKKAEQSHKKWKETLIPLRLNAEQEKQDADWQKFGSSLQRISLPDGKIAWREEGGVRGEKSPNFPLPALPKRRMYSVALQAMAYPGYAITEEGVCAVCWFQDTKDAEASHNGIAEKAATTFRQLLQDINKRMERLSAAGYRGYTPSLIKETLSRFSKLALFGAESNALMNGSHEIVVTLANDERAFQDAARSTTKFAHFDTDNAAKNVDAQSLKEHQKIEVEIVRDEMRKMLTSLSLGPELLDAVVDRDLVSSEGIFVHAYENGDVLPSTVGANMAKFAKVDAWIIGETPVVGGFIRAYYYRRNGRWNVSLRYDYLERGNSESAVQKTEGVRARSASLATGEQIAGLLSNFAQTPAARSVDVNKKAPPPKTKNSVVSVPVLQPVMPASQPETRELSPDALFDEFESNEQKIAEILAANENIDTIFAPLDMANAELEAAAASMDFAKKEEEGKKGPAFRTANKLWQERSEEYDAVRERRDKIAKTVVSLQDVKNELERLRERQTEIDRLLN